MLDESMSKKSLKSVKPKIKDFWLKYESKIVLLVGLVLVAIISFEIGALQGQKWQQQPLIIEKNGPVSTCISESVSNTAEVPKASQNANFELQKGCVLVGSKNSNKYHIPTCQWAKRIKPENIVCFKSVEEAIAKNYQPDKNCIK